MGFSKFAAVALVTFTAWTSAAEEFPILAKLNAPSGATGPTETEMAATIELVLTFANQSLDTFSGLSLKVGLSGLAVDSVTIDDQPQQVSSLYPMPDLAHNTIHTARFTGRLDSDTSGRFSAVLKTLSSEQRSNLIDVHIENLTAPPMAEEEVKPDLTRSQVNAGCSASGPSWLSLILVSLAWHRRRRAAL